jgi:hypothetical protein
MHRIWIKHFEIYRIVSFKNLPYHLGFYPRIK